MTLTEQIRSLYNEIVETRRYVHMHPELSHQEIATPAFIADGLEELGELPLDSIVPVLDSK